MMTTHRVAAMAATALALMALAACSASSTSEPTKTTAAAPSAAAGSATIEEAFQKLGCKTDDMLGTQGDITDASGFDLDPKQLHQGACRPLDGGTTVFLYEYASPEDAQKGAGNNSVEAKPGELFQDGAVLILADAPNEQKLVNAFAEAAN